jgi:hypothetical protein
MAVPAPCGRGYKSTLVDADNYLLTVYRYIELNPVRANMVVHASEFEPGPRRNGRI